MNTPTSQEANSPAPEIQSSRREMLIIAAKCSGALAATSVPAKVLASQSICTHPDAGPQIRCGISGMTSGIGSRDTYTTCEGYSPGWWGQVSFRNPSKPRRVWPCPYDQPYTNVFASTKCAALEPINGHTPTLFDIVKKKADNKYTNTDMYHWVCAYLNALSGGPKGNFPYSGARVVDFCADRDSEFKYEEALAFFKKYMETHTS